MIDTVGAAGRVNTPRLPQPSRRACSWRIEHIDRREGGCDGSAVIATNTRWNRVINVWMLAGSNTSVRNCTDPPIPAGSPASVKCSARENAKSIRAESGIGRQRADLQITQPEVGNNIVVPGQVLPGQHHLHQRVMGQGAGGVEPLHQHLKGHILMLKRGQTARPHLPQHLGHTGIAAQVDPQHQRVDEKPDHLIERRVAPARDGNPTATSALALSLASSTARADWITMKLVT